MSRGVEDGYQHSTQALCICSPRTRWCCSWELASVKPSHTRLCPYTAEFSSNSHDSSLQQASQSNSFSPSPARPSGPADNRTDDVLDTLAAPRLELCPRQFPCIPMYITTYNFQRTSHPHNVHRTVCSISVSRGVTRVATQRAQRRVAVALAGGGRGLGNVWSMTKGGRPSECFPEPYRKGPAIESSRGQRGDRIESWATRSRWM